MIHFTFRKLGIARAAFVKMTDKEELKVPTSEAEKAAAYDLLVLKAAMASNKRAREEAEPEARVGGPHQWREPPEKGNKRKQEDSSSSDSEPESVSRNWQTTDRMLAIIYALVAVSRGIHI